MNLRVCHKDHGWVHPVSLWHNGGYEVSVAITRQRRGGAQPYSSCLMLASNEMIPTRCERVVATVRWHTGSEQPSGTQFEDFSPRLTVHSQDVGSYLTGGTCQKSLCLQLKPGIDWRNHPGPLRTSHEGCTSWWFGNLVSRGSMDLWTAARGGVQHQAEPESWRS
jgi:hypothetical protein